MQSDAFTLYQPKRRETPVVFSSPHSGRAYPPAFLANSVLDAHTIRSSEDAFVDDLFRSATDFGAPLIAACAPRAFIDLNRAADEMDSSVVEGVARSPHNPRVASGLGVIPRVVSGGRAIYRGKMSLQEAEARIRSHWQPYHAALRRLTNDSHTQFGQSVLIDCHSMPHEAIETHSRPGFARPEVVLGDRFGATATRDVMDQVEAAFRRAGLRVSRNTPFAGAYIAQTYGRPSRGFHVVQVEIDRALYMDEARIVPSADFESFQALISGVIAEIAGIGRLRVPLAAE
ncbi:MAG: N-formylglutamate amidohydrolase [Pseudotabrizicola sp.]|uniref:N-formylglutamate amidohydrolase n=1 Tax=Pseudotabrizicola sp. TaxID=2939647 RepID=UPI0027212CFB|nr:N-formylglutamate amidohydrolase [Pseudotabrizicola sp.]MDO8885064.1 N-formylglutamate amidohydrolase [Pseudotabrizicola sp.]MDP2083292.1 N-formylglutamate amidohydrolase [Pseudotabrizicola sp.]MDZ7575905.1 N-formylglutamate amidohydrolase [Pseudotabrizicola sp.]